MMCFDVSVKGPRIALVGHPDAATLHAVIEATPSLQAAVVELVGELPPQGEKSVVASWGTHVCRIGDEVTIRLVDAPEGTEPVVVLQDAGEIASDSSAPWPICFSCGKSYRDVHEMIATQRAHICDSCIDEIVQLRQT